MFTQYCSRKRHARSADEPELMLDPGKKLTPLQRRRLKQGKPITSRILSETEKKHEDEMDKDKLQDMTRRKSPPKRKDEEQEDIEYRKEARHAEHLRREAVKKERQAEIAAMNQRKAQMLQDTIENDMAEREAEQQKERDARAAKFDEKYGSGTKKKKEEEAPAETEADKEARLQELEKEAAISAERDRLEAMVDDAVMTEERRLRALLDVGTPDNLGDVTRRLRANDPRLIKVTLRQNTIGFPEAAKLADAIAHNTSLLALDFRYNKIGDYGCKLIADAIQTCPSIGELRIQPNDTGRTGMQALQEAARLCQFQAMSISSATLAMPEDSSAPLLLRAPNDELEPEED